MVREIVRSYETAAAQIDNFAKPEEVKQEEREKVNRLWKKSSAVRFVEFNRPKSFNQKNVFVAEILVIRRKMLTVQRKIVNVLNQ